MLATAIVLASPTAAARVRAPAFLDNLNEAVASRDGLPIVVSFVATWCPTCERMRRTVWADSRILELEQQFVWVRIDIDRHPSIARTYGVEGVPRIVLMDSGGVIGGGILGAIGAEELADRLTEFRDAEWTGEAQPGESVTEGGTRSGVTWAPRGYRSDGTCFSHVGYGPLALRSASPFQSLRLSMRPRTPSTLAKGQFDLALRATWTNVWAVDAEDPAQASEYFLDFETLRAEVALAYGLSDTFEIEAEFQASHRFGGSMDGLIQGFHDLLGLSQGGRDLVGKGLFAFEVAPVDGRTAVALTPDDRGAFSRTAQLSLQQNVTCGSRHLPAIAWSVSARRQFSDADVPAEGNDWDFGLSLSASRKFGRFYMYGSLGHAWFGRSEFRGLELGSTQWSLLLAGEWHFRARQSLLLQLLTTEGAIDDFGPFSATSNEITLGYKWEFVPRTILEVGLIENIVEFDNSPDFGIHLGVSRRM